MKIEIQRERKTKKKNKESKKGEKSGKGNNLDVLITEEEEKRVIEMVKKNENRKTKGGKEK